MSRLRTFVLAATATAAGPAFGQSCPPPLDSALRLVLVTTPGMDSSKARLQLFERSSPAEPWRALSAGEPAMVGKNGLAWGFSFGAFKREGEPDKIEGDKRTPAGFFRIGSSFGFAKAKRDNYIAVEPGDTVCVEDAASPAYNTITTRRQLAPGTKADNMSDTSLFRNGLFVDYPSDRATRRGSCIFIHVWKTPDTTTQGCVALPEPRVVALQDFARPGAVLGVLPETARDRFSACLPVTLAPAGDDTGVPKP
jgi:L,D-peptidoglycan transpeptidase YkuD (ErfK/YbiS/YcfS/YnhG family)